MNNLIYLDDVVYIKYMTLNFTMANQILENVIYINDLILKGVLNVDMSYKGKNYDNLLHNSFSMKEAMEKAYTNHILIDDMMTNFNNLNKYLKDKFELDYESYNLLNNDPTLKNLVDNEPYFVYALRESSLLRTLALEDPSHIRMLKYNSMLKDLLNNDLVLKNDPILRNI